jgi:carbonic anhydrase
MSTLDSMLERNKELAARQSAAGTLMPSLPRALPNVKAIIVGCADMRVDPAHVLGVKPGEAVVISWVYSGESVRSRESFLEAAASFTSSYSNTLIAASLASSAIPPC